MNASTREESDPVWVGCCINRGFILEPLPPVSSQQCLEWPNSPSKVWFCSWSFPDDGCKHSINILQSILLLHHMQWFREC